MSRNTWNLIKEHRNFHVNVYRRSVLALICSLGLSVVLGMLLFYMYIREPEPDYYATSGITPPVRLQSLSAPNESSQALLPPDPSSESGIKVIPQ